MNAMRVEHCTILICLLCVTTVPLGPAAAQPAQALAVASFYAPETDLRAYVDEALGRHPGVREALARYRGALQAVPQAEALPDPMLTFTYAEPSWGGTT